MRILLTGGTGFLGSHIAELLRSRGDDVRATVRASSNTKQLKSLGVEPAEVSLENGSGLDDALRDIDAVIHCAGGGRVRSNDEFYVHNVLTTETLLRAIERVRPTLKRYVHASSVSAVPALSQYGKAKQDADKLVLAASARIPTTLMRLPALYGPGDTRWAALYKTVARGVQPVFGRSPPLSLLYATDAASSLVAPLDSPHPSASIFSPEDGVPITQRDLGAAVAEAIGTSNPVGIPVPGPVLRAAARASELVGKITGREVFLTLDKVKDMLGEDWVCDSSSLRRELGWTSKVTLREGTKLTGEWYRREGLI